MAQVIPHSLFSTHCHCCKKNKRRFFFLLQLICIHYETATITVTKKFCFAVILWFSQSFGFLFFECSLHDVEMILWILILIKSVLLFFWIILKSEKKYVEILSAPTVHQIFSIGYMTAVNMFTHFLPL